MAPAFRRPSGAKLIILSYDSIIAGISLLLANLLRTGLSPEDVLHSSLITAALLFALVASAVFAAFGLHRAVWRHTSTGEIVRIVEAVTTTILVYLFLMFLLGRLDDLPRSAPLIQWPLLVVILGASRLTWRLIYERIRRRPSPDSKPLIVVGSGDACSLLLRGIAGGAATPYRPVGIIDPVGRNSGRRIHGTLVLGRPSQLSEIVSRIKKVEDAPLTIVFAEDVGQSQRGLAREAESLGVNAVRMPNIVKFRTALSEDKVELEPLSLQALIGREPVQLDHQAIRRFISGNRVLITGAGGSIGSELVPPDRPLRPPQRLAAHSTSASTICTPSTRSCATAAWTLPEPRCFADVRDGTRLRRSSRMSGPTLVFHAAALKHVPMVEANPVEGVLTNSSAPATSPMRPRRRGARDGADLDRQGGQPDQRHGRDQAVRRVLLPGARLGRRGPSRTAPPPALHDRALRQRSGLLAARSCRCFKDSLPRRPADRHPPGDARATS